MYIKVFQRNMVSGIICFVLGVILYTQIGETDIVLEGFLGSIEYMQAITLIFAFLGICICFIPKKKSNDDFPIITKRVLSLGIIFLTYGVIFESIGFFISSYIASCACAISMGWKKIPFLLIINGVAIVLIWAIFKYLLKIALPSGILL